MTSCPLCGGMGEPLFMGFACRGARDCKNYVRDTIPVPTKIKGFSVFQAARLFRQGVPVQWYSRFGDVWQDLTREPDPLDDLWQGLEWRLKP